MPKATQPQLPVHPLIAGLVPEEGQPAEATIKLSGYAGPPGQAGKVRLYSSLNDLTHYLEFDQNALVHTAAASESELPNQGHHVWVRASAPVRWVHEYPTASSFAGDIARNVYRLDGWRQ
jgi:hypothetical protein